MHMTSKEKLIDKISQRRAIVGVIGLGYVGLPLAVEFAEAGFDVLALDVDASKVEKINSGDSYIDDVPAERIKPLIENGRLCATTDYKDLQQTDTISICVPTPLRKTKDPDMSYILQSMSSLVELLHEGMLIVLESTTYPGTTEEVIQPHIEEKGFTVGEDIFIAFSPERIDPGNKTYGVHNTPKVIGGVTPACNEIASALYGSSVNQVVAVSSPTTAEMVKLLENTFRAVNIGLVNEVAIMCDKLNIDVWEVIDAAATKPFGFMPFYPGPGLGGHCIPVDPHYLSWKLKMMNYTARFIELASEVNTSMPQYVVTKIADALNEAVKPVHSSRIVILGVAYKPNVDDIRESPALDIIQLLQDKGAEVIYHDPYVSHLKFDDVELDSSDYSDELLSNADCVVIVTNHDKYDWDHVLEHSPLILDTRNSFNGTVQHPKLKKL
jgi:UDP-N-acetyl-D-glucosamine dehydrogenase